MKRTVTMQIPVTLDEYFGSLARNRMISKAAIFREVLLDHVKSHNPEVIAAVQAEMAAGKEGAPV